MVQDFRLGALAVAELTGARAFDDPELLVLLSQALLGAELGREDEAVTLLERALSAVPPDALWLQAEIRPLLAAAARKEPERAAREVTRALPLVWEPSVRSILLRERAEAKMALGQVRASAADARAALAAASTPVQRALARFELGLALERAGDLPSALSEIHVARLSAPALGGSELGILDLPGVFVFRPEDAHYVAALDAMAAARTASDAREALLGYERAVVAWEHYMAQAPADDRWLFVARVHATECERARARLASEQPKPREPEDSGSFF
jgi:tetratricopeptide (TPR) repeat protein